MPSGYYDHGQCFATALEAARSTCSNYWTVLPDGTVAICDSALQTGNPEIMSLWVTYWSPPSPTIPVGQTSAYHAQNIYFHPPPCDYDLTSVAASGGGSSFAITHGNSANAGNSSTSTASTVAAGYRATAADYEAVTTIFGLVLVASVAIWGARALLNVFRKPAES